MNQLEGQKWYFTVKNNIHGFTETMKCDSIESIHERVREIYRLVQDDQLMGRQHRYDILSISEPKKYDGDW